jgi:hypothetical protein
MPVASGKSLDKMRICLSLFGLAIPRKSLDARDGEPEEGGGKVRGGTEQEYSPGYNRLLLVHKTNWNGHPRSCHPQKVFAGKRSRRTRIRRNEGRRFAKSFARLQVFAVVVKECVGFGVSLFGLATLRKALGARRTARRKQKNCGLHPATLSARLRSAATRTQGEWDHGFAVLVALGRD